MRPFYRRMTLGRINPSPAMKFRVSPVRLYLTRDRKSVVEEGNPAAAFLLVGAGARISEADVTKYALEGKIPAPGAPTTPSPPSPPAPPAPPVNNTPVDPPPADPPHHSGAKGKGKK